jgi:hypothetical protein
VGKFRKRSDFLWSAGSYHVAREEGQVFLCAVRLSQLMGRSPLWTQAKTFDIPSHTGLYGNGPWAHQESHWCQGAEQLGGIGSAIHGGGYLASAD